MPKWIANCIAVLVGLMAVWGVLVGMYYVGMYYVGGWSQEGRSVCAFLGGVAGLGAVALMGTVFSERGQ